MKKVYRSGWVFSCIVVVAGVLGGHGMAQGALQHSQDSLQQDSARFSQMELSKAKIIRASGKHMEAYQLYESLLEKQPGNYDALFEMAQVANELKAYQFVIPYLNRALAIKPKEGRILKYYLDFARAQGSPEHATRALQGLHEAYPDEESYYFDLAYIRFYQEDYEAARQLLTEAESRFGVNEKLLDAQARFLDEEGKIEEAIQVLKKWDQLENPGIGGYMMHTELLGKQKKYKEALALLDQVQLKFPDQTALLNLSRSDIYRFQGDRKRSLEELEKAFRSGQLEFQMQSSVLYSAAELLEKDDLNQLSKLFESNFPENIQKDMVLGDIYAQTQQLPEALKYYKAALDQDANLTAVWDQILNIHLYTGDYASVITDGEKALTQFVNHPKYKFLVGNAYFLDKQQPEQERMDQARKYLEEALNLQNPEDSTMLSDIYSTLGDIYNAKQMFAESDVAYEEALENNPDNIHALNNYSYYLAVRRDKLNKALEYSSKALTFEPENPTNLDTHAWVLYQNADFQQALTYIEKAIKNSKNPSSTVLDHSGDIYYRLGNKKEALKRWKRALKVAESKGEESGEILKKVKSKKMASDL